MCIKRVNGGCFPALRRLCFILIGGLQRSNFLLVNSLWSESDKDKAFSLKFYVYFSVFVRPLFDLKKFESATFLEIFTVLCLISLTLLVFLRLSSFLLLVKVLYKLIQESLDFYLLICSQICTLLFDSSKVLITFLKTISYFSDPPAWGRNYILKWVFCSVNFVR